MKRDPVNFIVSIDDSLMAEFFYWWTYYDKPCSFQVQKPKTAGLTAIRITIDSNEAADFLLKAKERTGCKLYQK
ncbi:hypothetical protein H8788_23645 [Parabacteroides faecis]|uniref:hypothetical protein n=1 Tax=Parabacteroides TaxID=375288 RepID=UPI000EFDD6ED|nr:MULTISPECIES: hypothetical protein [Parabacteroides]MBC8620732.1 hypothetical protein [Parabacteroides faecis]RHR92726.1 hypothetical protein DWW23_23375 [Parabacteroides sp. AF14-59]